ncbi:MAG: SOS response-associated peptidase [Rhodospirillaceae bacterium]|nr:SOS response-associated peptidase [Rhodospirillaceae bacterium]MBT5809572.1 SOS response-associated peptidase [Rhodospirillaceae bacterium]
MCGRYSLTSPVDSVARLFGFDERPNLMARYNIAPTQDALIVRGGSQVDSSDSSEALHGVTVRWGLTPSWAKSLDDGVRMINARSETVRDKPAFRAAYGARRCLIPADGFYEWRKVGGGKQAYRIAMDGNSVFAFAGLWESWRAPSGADVETCAILTTEATPRLTPVHHRMPVILNPGDYAVWLNGSPEAAAPLMRPYESEALQAYPVGAAVGNVRNDGPELWAAAPEPRDDPPPPKQLDLL